MFLLFEVVIFTFYSGSPLDIATYYWSMKNIIHEKSYKKEPQSNDPKLVVTGSVDTFEHKELGTTLTLGKFKLKFLHLNTMATFIVKSLD